MELTFENWLSGKIELKETYKNNIPEKDSRKFELFQNCQISFDLFPETEKFKINEAQKNYFLQLSTQWFDELYRSFKSRYDNAQTPLNVLEEELFRLNQIINGKWSLDSLGMYINEFTNLTLNENSFGGFDNYILRIKKREFKPYYDFMPSPNSKYYSLTYSIIPEIYAEVFYNLYNTLSKHHPNPTKIWKVPQEFLIEPENIDSKIFANGWASKAFEIMEQTVAVNPKTYKGDYALIYNCLHSPHIGGIIDIVDKNAFVEFINNRIEGEDFISVREFRSSISLDKNRTIHYGLKYYLNRVNFKGDIKKLLTKVTK